MPATPNITLTANLETILAGAETAGSLTITLCNFGPFLPAVAGVGLLADAGVPQPVGPQVGSTPLSVELWGNDQITPGTTFYCVCLLDDAGNTIQCANYLFTGEGTIDLSEALPMTPGQPAALPYLAYLPCAGSVPGTVYNAPGQVIAVAYNGVLMPKGMAAPTLSYTLAGTVIALNFMTETGNPNDRIDALCIVNP